MSQASGHEPIDFEVHQEEDVVSSAAVLRVAVTSVVIGAIGVFFGGVILAAATGTLRPSFAGPGGPKPVGRTLSEIEQTPVRDTRTGLDLRDAQERELRRWGWVDRRAGVATIPIERAIDVLVAEQNGGHPSE